MEPSHPLTITVEQAATVLGVSRSTAYELVRTGDLTSLRLRRRIVVPVAHLAEQLCVDPQAVWAVLQARPATSASGAMALQHGLAGSQRMRAPEARTLFE